MSLDATTRLRLSMKRRVARSRNVRHRHVLELEPLEHRRLMAVL
jgi:hypothetical protein